MRTTLTIADDVAVRLKRLQRIRSTSLKAIVNEVLRVGLKYVDSDSAVSSEPYRITPVSLGSRLTQLDNIAEVLASYEREDHQ